MNGTEVRSLMPQHWYLPVLRSIYEGSQTQVWLPFMVTGVVHGFLLQSAAVVVVFAIFPQHPIATGSYHVGHDLFSHSLIHSGFPSLQLLTSGRHSGLVLSGVQVGDSSQAISCLALPAAFCEIQFCPISFHAVHTNHSGTVISNVCGLPFDIGYE